MHGNWNLANSKARLHTFLQQRRIPADFNYFSEGPDHARFGSYTTLSSDRNCTMKFDILY